MSDASALLRIAAFPAGLWLAGAVPALFERVRGLDAAEERYRAAAADVADGIGAVLVPHPSLHDGERGTVLTLRRRLHRGELAPCDAVIAIAERLAESALAGELRLVQGLGAAITTTEREIARAAEAEEIRLHRLAWELTNKSEALRRLVTDTNPDAWQDLCRRVGRAEPWDSKQMRKRADYLWRLLDRATTKATPRGWFGHVAMLPVAPEPGPLGNGNGNGNGSGSAGWTLLGDEIEAEWIENVFERRRRRAADALGKGDPATRVALSALLLADEDGFRFWTSFRDAKATAAVNEVRLRQTPTLGAIVSVLNDGPRSLGELQSLIPLAREGQAEVLRRFLGHLAELGILELALPPRVQVSRSRSVTALSRDRKVAQGAGFLDIYRTMSGPLPEHTARRLDALVGQALRVVKLAGAAQQHGEIPPEITEDPRPVLEVFAEQLAKAKASGHSHAGGWPRATGEDGPWDRLLGWIGAHADGAKADHQGIASLDLSADLLTGLGVPEAMVDWPLDALLRPLGPDTGLAAVLHSVARAGILDARFVPTLERLRGSAPNADSYREFLAELERQTGGTFVELLVPPLNDRAANAVRRPVLTSCWTGDHDPDSYFDPGALGRRPLRHLPLGSITVRRAGDRLVAEAGGAVVWPINHATRSHQPPWHVLGGLLLRATPLPFRRSLPQLTGSLGAFPDRAVMPRITVGGGLVLSCAQWRLPREPLWDTGASVLTKIRALDRLRDELGLPRFCYVSGHPVRSALPCDLESLRAIRTLERVGREGWPEVVLVEALPMPERFPIRRRLQPEERHAAELLVRLPFGVAPRELATRARQALAGVPVPP